MTNEVPKAGPVAPTAEPAPLMPGVGYLFLSEAAVIQALQYWLEQKVWACGAKPPTLTAVSLESDPGTYGGTAKAFRLTLQS